MRYELLHDSLAAAIDEMASAELKTYLQMREHIQRRYDSYREGKSGLLTKEDLEYIRPYLPDLELEDELNEFVRKSEAKLKQQRLLRIAAVLSIILLISILAIKSWIVSRHYEAQYLNARANQVLQKNPTVALRMSERALRLNDNEIIKNDIYKIYRTRSFYHTIARLDGPVMDALVGKNNQMITILPNQNTPQIRNSNGELKTEISGHIHPVYDLAISASGEWVSAGNDKTAILWDETGKQIQVFKPKETSQAPDIRSVDISADGQWILTGASNGEINLWQRGLDTVYYTYSADGEVVDLSITGDGKTFVAAILNRNSMIFTYEEEGFVAKILSEFHRDITAMKLLPDGSRLFTGDSKGSLQTWIPEDGTYDFRGTSYIHKGEITMINISPNGDWLLAASRDSSASVSSLHNRDLFKLYGHTGAVTSIFMNKDQTLITSSEDSTLKTWTTPFALYNQTFSYHRQGVNKVAFSPDEKLIASGGKDRRVVLTDILTGEKIWEHREHADPVMALNFRDSAVQSIDEYSNYIIFHPDQSTAQSIPMGERSLSAAVFSPDGQQVLTGGFDSIAQLWDVNQQTLLLELSLQSSIFSLAFAPDQSGFLIGCEDGKAYLFGPSGNQLQVFEGHQSGVTAVNFTPSSKKIITGSEDQRVILWNLSGKQLQQFREYALPIQAVSVNADETLLAVAYRQKSAILIDLQEGYVIDDFRGHKDFVNDIIFPKQGNILATACDDKFVRVWTKVKLPLFHFLKQGKLENMDDRMKNQFQIE